jgi:hypothetical protein
MSLTLLGDDNEEQVARIFSASADVHLEVEQAACTKEMMTMALE